MNQNLKQGGPKNKKSKHCRQAYFSFVFEKRGVEIMSNSCFNPNTNLSLAKVASHIEDI